MSRAVIYVRVSSADQVSGFSLDVQERVCRDYCDRHDWPVGLVAREEGESAKTTDRRELQRVLSKLKKPNHGFTHFVCYDLSRLTRETADYFALKGFLAAAGVQLVAVTQPVDESPTGKFMGTILAAAGQFDNDVKREKTVAGMKEAIKRGIWPWQPPLGYLAQRAADRRATLVQDPEVAPLIRHAFDRIASGVVTQEEAREELRRRGLAIPRETFSRLIHNPIYCGRIVAPRWGIEGRLASRPIVSEETWRRAQLALGGAPRGWHRSALRPDFPFRWWTRCADCSRPLTGSWSNGKRTRHPYYRCPNGCQNVARGLVHDSFLELLTALTCPPGVWALAEEIVRDIWGRRVESHRAQVEASRRRLLALEQKEERVIAALLDGQLDGATVKTMRSRIAAERAEIAEATPIPLPEFEHALRLGRQISESPRATWDAISETNRPGFLRAVFPARLDYHRKLGFRTPAKSLYMSNLTSVSRALCERWYPDRGGLSAADLPHIVAGWAALDTFLEDQCAEPLRP